MTTPPGWYDDRHGHVRWWDGARWTERVSTPGLDGPDETGSTAESVHPGGVIAAPQPKDRLWIVWVVLGVVALGFVIAIVVLISLMFARMPTGTGASDGAPPGPVATEEPGVHEPVDPPETLDEQAAVDAVMLNTEAWLTGDCEAFFTTTTADLRDEIEITDCAVFAEASLDFADSVDGYETSVRSVETFGVLISVSTTETFSSRYDDDGNDTGVSLDYEDRYEYKMWRSDTGAWEIDAVTDD